MKISKKIVLMAAMFAILFGFSSNAFATEVLYVPFEDYIPNGPGLPLTSIYIGIVYPFEPILFQIFGDPVLVEGKVGNAFEFGGNGYIYIPGWLDPTLNFGYDDFAITFWVKTTSHKTINTISDKRSTSGIGYHVALYNGRPLLQMGDTDYGYFNYCPSSSTNGAHVNDGLWHKVAIYVDRDNTAGGKMYVDGLCVLTFNPTRHTGTITSYGPPLLIGKHKDSSAYDFVGTLDEYRHFLYIPPQKTEKN
ncbi:MAG: LamG domain-containing protein [bacterium]|nr:LamG domain-containing protein [bacterium]